MARKNFKIAPNIAKGISDSVKTVAEHRGELNYNMMDIQLIEPDPENPRKLSLKKNDLYANIENLSIAKRRDLDNLAPLIDSIKKVGVRNAVDVYKFENKYRLIAGERRWLASLFAGKEFIPVHICEKPKNFDLKYLQWIENIQREDLTLWEKYINLKQISEAFLADNPTIPELKAIDIARLLGVSQKQSYRLYNLLNAEKVILEGIEQGKISSFQILDELAKVKNQNKLKIILEEIQNGSHASTKNIIGVIKETSAIKPKKTELLSKGRPARKINLGTLENPSTAKMIFEILISDDRFRVYSEKFADIDWNSNKSINNAFKKLLNIAANTD